MTATAAAALRDQSRLSRLRIVRLGSARTVCGATLRFTPRAAGTEDKHQVPVPMLVAICHAAQNGWIAATNMRTTVAAMKQPSAGKL